jgi:hypothetical protein
MRGEEESRRGSWGGVEASVSCESSTGTGRRGEGGVGTGRGPRREVTCELELSPSGGVIGKKMKSNV